MVRRWAINMGWAALAAMLALSQNVAAAAAPAACEDTHSGCGSWADGGECTKNPGFMKGACAESCGFCTPPPMLEATDDALLGPERVVLQIQYGDPPTYGEIVLGFYPSVAPVTVEHILKLVRMGGCERPQAAARAPLALCLRSLVTAPPPSLADNTNEIFRVDKGFVAQVQGVDGGRRAPMSKALRTVARRNVPDEFSTELTHKRGMLSMGKFDEPNTGTSSFSMVLGNGL
jgi:cyclophilin family peptidyl-prolyl cis-trans isomerase